MRFAPLWRSLFRHLNFQKWSEPGVFCAFWLSKYASRHNGVKFFISHLARWLRTRRFSEPTFRPSGATNHRKNRLFRDFQTSIDHNMSHPCRALSKSQFHADPAMLMPVRLPRQWHRQPAWLLSRWWLRWKCSQPIRWPCLCQFLTPPGWRHNSGNNLAWTWWSPLRMRLRWAHTYTYIYNYIYTYIYVCVCACVRDWWSDMVRYGHYCWWKRCILFILLLCLLSWVGVAQETSRHTGRTREPDMA